MRRILPTLLLLMIVSWLAWGALKLRPPAAVTIYSGPEGGSYHQYAKRYLPLLKEVSEESQIEPVSESLRIPDRVAGSPNGQGIGFASIRTGNVQHAGLLSVGVVDTQPLFIFYRQALGPGMTLQRLASARMVTPPVGSASAMAADALLKLHGTDVESLRIERRPLAQAIQALRAGEVDVGFFMLGADNRLVQELMADRTLRLMSLPNADSVARHIDFFVPVKIHRGVFDVAGDIPAQDIHLVGSPIDVIVHRDLNPAVLHRLLMALEDAHRQPSLLSRRGTYPNVTDSAWPIHPAARAQARDGPMWMYQRLWPWLAAIVDVHWPLLLAIAGMGTLWGGIKNLMALMTTTKHLMALIIVQRMLERRADPAASRDDLDLRLQALADTLLEDETMQKRAKKSLERLRRPPPESS